jgi:hypothetical protein
MLELTRMLLHYTLLLITYATTLQEAFFRMHSITPFCKSLSSRWSHQIIGETRAYVKDVRSLVSLLSVIWVIWLLSIGSREILRCAQDDKPLAVILSPFASLRVNSAKDRWRAFVQPTHLT